MGRFGYGLAVLALFLALIGPAAAETQALVDPDVTMAPEEDAEEQAFMLERSVLEQDPDELMAEIGMLRAVGEGLLLVLAACEDEPHCVTGIAEREVRNLLEEVEVRVTELEVAHNLPSGFDRVLGGYAELQRIFHRVAEGYEEVERTVQLEEVEGTWRDHFTADTLVEGAENLDYLNEHVSLDRFEDVDRPLPIN